MIRKNKKISSYKSEDTKNRGEPSLQGFARIMKSSCLVHKLDGNPQQSEETKLKVIAYPTRPALHAHRPAAAASARENKHAGRWGLWGWLTPAAPLFTGKGFSQRHGGVFCLPSLQEQVLVEGRREFFLISKTRPQGFICIFHSRTPAAKSLVVSLSQRAN